MAEESIYRLIPDEEIVPPKAKMHRSRHGVVPPSYSTFPRKEAARGADTSASMLFAAPSGAIGRDVGPDVDPKKYLKAHGSGRDVLPEVKQFVRHETIPKKSGVPLKTEKPVMGLITEKNFVHANAVEAICSTAKKKPTANDQPLAMERKTFGKKPAYLETIKKERELDSMYVAEARAREAEHAADMQREFVRGLDEEEKERLIDQLRTRWEEKHSQYQSLPFARDTAMQIARKEALEKELKEIETALMKLSKKVVYVYSDTAAPHITRWARDTAMRQAQGDAERMARGA